jgi:adenylate kinase family enzyme
MRETTLMRRVMVIGCSGAGKSTLSRQLSTALRLPLIGLDLHYWKAGWKTTVRPEWRERVAALVAAPEWVMDGNFAGTFDLRMRRADMLIWLDFPRMVCLRRVLARVIRDHGRNRPDLPEGCPEKFDLAFLWYVWTFNAKERPLIAPAIARFGAHLDVIALADDRQVDRFRATHGVS